MQTKDIVKLINQSRNSELAIICVRKAGDKKQKFKDNISTRHRADFFSPARYRELMQ